MAHRRKSLGYLDYWPVYAAFSILIVLMVYTLVDSVQPRSDEWCRGLRKGHFAGSNDRRQYLSLEATVEVGYQRSHLKVSDRLYTSEPDYIRGYYRGYRQGYKYTDKTKTQHLEDATRCDPDYMYLGLKRGYSY
jgi:hypothetical protein